MLRTLQQRLFLPVLVVGGLLALSPSSTARPSAPPPAGPGPTPLVGGIAPAKPSRAGHTERVTGLAFSPSGSTLASCGDNEVRLWSLPSLRLARKLGAGRDHVACLAWSADGTQVAGGSLDRCTYVWDAHSGRLLHTLGPGPDQVLHVAFAPQARQLATAAYNGVVTVYDLASGRAVQRLPGHCVAYAPNGREMATAGIDGRIHRYSVATGHELASMSAHLKCPQDLRYSPDSQLLASCADNVRLWRGAALQADIPSQRPGAVLTQVRWSSDGRTLLAASFLGEGQAWHRSAGNTWRAQPLLPGHPIQAVEISPDSQLLALGNFFGDVMLASVQTWRSLVVAPGRAHVGPSSAGRSRRPRNLPGQPVRVDGR